MGAQRGEDWAELADRVWVRRYAEWNVSVGVVAGSDGLLVVDTRATARQGRVLRDDVRRLRPGADVRWVVNTHVHFDHTFGNVAFDEAAIHAHENVAARLGDELARVRRAAGPDDGPEEEPGDGSADGPDAALVREVLDTRLRVPDETFSSVRTIDLGDRYVELFHPGRGHTDGDLLLRVPDVDVVFAGDLVEEAGPPGFGEDCFPLDWPASLDVAMGVLTPSTRVVPGHGAVVDQAFVQAQSADIARVANTIGELVHAGVPLEAALEQGEWPWEAEHLRAAVHRGYQHAGPVPRRLPLV